MGSRDKQSLFAALRGLVQGIRGPKMITIPPRPARTRGNLRRGSVHVGGKSPGPTAVPVGTDLGVTMLLVGFDSAWTSGNTGGLVGVFRFADGSIAELGDPLSVRYSDASRIIQGWQAEYVPESAIILLDQPTIVPNSSGQRPIESIAGSPVGRHGGGMQPSSTSKTDMFGPGAPVWGFLETFGGAADPREPLGPAAVIETYPCLALIALDWLLPGSGSIHQLPKYNPANRAKFSLAAWRFVCEHTAAELRAFGLDELPRWVDSMAGNPAPRKGDQDGLDACLCLIAALHLAERRPCLMVGDMASGYIVVPHGDMLAGELKDRCWAAGYEPADWVCTFRLAPPSPRGQLSRDIKEVP